MALAVPVTSGMIQIAAFILLLVASPVWGQDTLGHVAAEIPFPTVADVPQLSDESVISIVTIYPGEEVYSLFGHTAVRVTDPALNLDLSYNYGTFDFNQPNFILRFVRGFMAYRLADDPFDLTMRHYRFQNRSVVEQVLDLELSDRQSVFQFLESNLLPENAVYPYDFIYDNCSTRPRDLLQWALGARLSMDEYVPPDKTLRELIADHVESEPLLHFGIDLGLGMPMDQEPSAQTALFLPIELFRALDAATVDSRPLVVRTDMLFQAHDIRKSSFDYVTLLTTLLLIGAISGTFLLKSSRGLRIFDAVLMTIIGVLGIVLFAMWFFTEHHVTKFNIDLLWAWPTHAFLGYQLVRKSIGKRMRVYWAAAAATAAMMAILGIFGRVAVPVAAIPIALIVAIRLAARTRQADQEGETVVTTPDPHRT